MPDIIVSVANEKDIEQLYREYACTELVHCWECKHCEKSCYAGFFHCEVWDQEISMKAHDPYKYFCAEGEPKESDSDTQ